MQHTTQYRLEYHAASVHNVSPEDQTSAQSVGRNDMTSRRYRHYNTAQTKCASKQEVLHFEQHTNKILPNTIELQVKLMHNKQTKECVKTI